MDSEAHRDGPCPGPDVGHPLGTSWSSSEPLQSGLHQELRLRAGNEDPPVHKKVQAEELPVAGDVSQRLALGASGHRIPQGRHDPDMQGFLPVAVELGPREIRMAHQKHLRSQAGLDAPCVFQSSGNLLHSFGNSDHRPKKQGLRAEY